MDYSYVFEGVFGESNSINSELKKQLHEGAYKSFSRSFSSVYSEKSVLVDKVIKNYKNIDAEFGRYIQTRPTKYNFFKFAAQKMHPKGIKLFYEEMEKSLVFKDDYQDFVRRLISAQYGIQLNHLLFNDEVFVRLNRLILPTNHAFYETYKNYVAEYKTFLEVVRKFGSDSKGKKVFRATTGILGNVVLPGLGTIAKQFMSKESSDSAYEEYFLKFCDAYDLLTNQFLDFLNVCLNNYRHIIFILYGGLLLECDKIQRLTGREIISFDIHQKGAFSSFTQKERDRIKDWFKDQLEKTSEVASKGYIKDARHMAQQLFHKAMISSADNQFYVEHMGDIELVYFDEATESLLLNIQRMSYSLCCWIENARIYKLVKDPLRQIVETEKYLKDMIMVPFDAINFKNTDDTFIPMFDLIANHVHSILKINDLKKLKQFIDFTDRFSDNAYARAFVRNESLKSMMYNDVANTLMLSISHFGYLMKLAALFSGEKLGENFKSKAYIEKFLETGLIMIKEVEIEYRRRMGKDAFYKFVKKYRKMLRNKQRKLKIKRFLPKLLIFTSVMICFAGGYWYYQNYDKINGIETQVTTVESEVVNQTSDSMIDVPIENVSDNVEVDLNKLLVTSDLTASSSSTLQEETNNGLLIHEANRVLDGDFSTVWSEGVKGPGYGEWIEFKASEAGVVNSVSLINGHGKNETLYYWNDRIMSFRLTFSDGTYEDFYCEDGMLDPQTFYLYTPVYTSSIRLTILDLYQGELYPDATIAEFSVNE